MTRNEFDLKVEELKNNSQCRSYLNRFITNWTIVSHAPDDIEYGQEMVLQNFNYLYPYMKKEFDAYLKLENEYLMSAFN